MTFIHSTMIGFGTVVYVRRAVESVQDHPVTDFDARFLSGAGIWSGDVIGFTTHAFAGATFGRFASAASLDL
jgi:hypothetical protein